MKPFLTPHLCLACRPLPHGLARRRAALWLPLGAAALALAACGKGPVAPATPEAAAQATTNGGAKASDALVLNAAQMREIGITLAKAEPSDVVPVGTVPGVVSLPPDARVAVTTPFAGTVLRVLVIQGQAVAKGAPLAIVRAPEAVQYGAALARSQAELPVASAQAARLGQLAREGIIAPARADEAHAALAATRATVAENRRLLGLAGAGRDGTITLRAPIAGRVSVVAVDAGAAIGLGNAPFVVENGKDLRVDLQVPEKLAGRVRPGMALSLTQEGRTVTGRVLSVGETLDPATRALSAKASLPAGSGLIAGKSVMAAIAAPAKAVAVPGAAITHVDGGDEVFIRTPTGFRAARVTVVGLLGNNAVITAGLHPGDVVAISGIAELKTLRQGQ